MTREEATVYWKQRSKHIHNWLEENEDVDFIGEYVEAIDMAIEAVSAKPQTDLISRADAIPIHEDGTLEVKVPNAHKVGRVLVMDTDSHIGGGLFYPDDAVPHGRWEKVVKGSKYKICTNCMKKQWLPSPKWNYCPHCGAKMGGGNND